jgi:hypothetical protein
MMDSQPHRSSPNPRTFRALLATPLPRKRTLRRTANQRARL